MSQTESDRVRHNPSQGQTESDTVRLGKRESDLINILDEFDWHHGYVTTDSDVVYIKQTHSESDRVRQSQTKSNTIPVRV